MFDAAGLLKLFVSASRNKIKPWNREKKESFRSCFHSASASGWPLTPPPLNVSDCQFKLVSQLREELQWNITLKLVIKWGQEVLTYLWGESSWSGCWRPGRTSPRCTVWLHWETKYSFFFVSERRVSWTAADLKCAGLQFPARPNIRHAAPSAASGPEWHL